jgi:hypothetical protein
MVDSALKRELETQLDGLPAAQQRQVLDFARGLTSGQPRGVRGERLLKLAGSIHPADLIQMVQAIGQNCENVDADGW